MFKDLTIRMRLLLAFSFMGALVLLSSLIGWHSNDKLSDSIVTLTGNSIPSLDGLWKVNEGQAQIQSAERLLLNPEINAEERQMALSQIDAAWIQIDEGLDEAENTPDNNAEEERIFAEFQQKWKEWEIIHQQFIALEAEFNQVGVRNPWAAQLALIQQGERDSPEFARAEQAKQLFGQLESFSLSEANPKYQEVSELAQSILNNNIAYTERVSENATQIVSTSRVLSTATMVFGPLVAIALGLLMTRLVVKYISTQVSQVVDVADEVAQGNLDIQISSTAQSENEISRIISAFQKMIQNLQVLVRQVQSSGVQVTSAATQIAAAGRQLEGSMREQVATTTETTATAQEITGTARELAATMDEVANLSMATTAAATESQTSLVQMETTIRQLMEATGEIAARLGAISEKANGINAVVTTITKVAEQTNLLSLNAAIEAEKAGEYGAGFAVVAREIRRLADQTAVATLEIESMVREMQSSVSTGVMEMDKFSTEVTQSVDLIAHIGSQSSQIIQQVQELSPRFALVNEGMDAQVQGAQQISEAMAQLNSVSVQTNDSFSDISAAITQLHQAAQNLQQEMNRFKIKESSQPHPPGNASSLPYPMNPQLGFAS